MMTEKQVGELGSELGQFYTRGRLIRTTSASIISKESLRDVDNDGKSAVLGARQYSAISRLEKNDQESIAESHEQELEVPESRSIWQASRKDKTVFIFLILREFTSYTAFSLLPPFFPAEAESRGISTTVTGWIFAIHPLLQFAAAPIAGKLIPYFGGKYMLIIGTLVVGISTVAFGCVDFLPRSIDTKWFVAACFLIRIVLAAGNSMAVTAVYAITTYTFSGNPATALVTFS